MNKTSRAVLQEAIKDKTDWLKLALEDVRRVRRALSDAEARAFVLQRDINNIRITLEVNK